MELVDQLRQLTEIHGFSDVVKALAVVARIREEQEGELQDDGRAAYYCHAAKQLENVVV